MTPSELLAVESRSMLTQRDSETLCTMLEAAKVARDAAEATRNQADLDFIAATDVYSWIDDELADRYPDAVRQWMADADSEIDRDPLDYYREAMAQ